MMGAALGELGWREAVERSGQLSVERGAGVGFGRKAFGEFRDVTGPSIRARVASQCGAVFEEPAFVQKGKLGTGAASDSGLNFLKWVEYGAGETAPRPARAPGDRRELAGAFGQKNDNPVRLPKWAPPQNQGSGADFLHGCDASHGRGFFHWPAGRWVDNPHGRH